ncbi:MAG: succinate dehydrogenase/fumarate reductase iron-sulfur subunit [Anaerolineales bacterium]|nr:succinate dehydrogenase/fumarate reductase iron-sulfur subunit [Anaerolineales bacterium]
MSTKWNITLRIYRQKGQGTPYFDDFELEVDPDEYLLDAIERVWAYQDRSLVFAHACHHSTCGACGMRVNGVEKLTCITPIREVTRNGETLKIEPMRNFPVISDLVVDLSSLYTRMEMVGHRPIVPLAEEPAKAGVSRIAHAPEDDYIRLSDCIECGLCISACPIATTTADYLGPAVLAGAQQHGLDGDVNLLSLVDCADGVWRCHHAFECNEVCPSFVDPGTKIMELRNAVIAARIKSLFGSRK